MPLRDTGHPEVRARPWAILCDAFSVGTEESAEATFLTAVGGLSVMLWMSRPRLARLEVGTRMDSHRAGMFKALSARAHTMGSWSQIRSQKMDV